MEATYFYIAEYDAARTSAGGNGASAVSPNGDSGVRS